MCRLAKYPWGLLLSVCALIIVYGCATFKGSVDIASGRQALVLGEYAQALPHFEQAAELEPNYVTSFTPFPENVWTYIGRSYYGMGDLTKARSALARSVQQHPKAILGHLYLGLTEMRQGEVQSGLDNAATGLRLLHGWFKTLDATNQYSCYWDPGDAIRNGTVQLLKQIESKDKPWQQLAPRLNRLGQRMEQEINLSSRDISDNNNIPCA